MLNVQSSFFFFFEELFTICQTAACWDVIGVEFSATYSAPIANFYTQVKAKLNKNMFLIKQGKWQWDSLVLNLKVWAEHVFPESESEWFKFEFELLNLIKCNEKSELPYINWICIV